MIILADNDILIKFAGCNLLDEFLHLLKTNTDNIFITESAKYSIRSQTKKIQNEALKLTITQFVGTLQTLPAVDSELLAQIQTFDDINDGEAYLMLAMHHFPNANFITGDKRCLKALIENKDKPPLTEVFNLLKNNVYCLESALLALIEIHGFDYINNRVSNRHISKVTDDGVLRLAFGKNKNQDNCIECLSSYCRDVISILAKINLYKELNHANPNL